MIFWDGAARSRKIDDVLVLVLSSNVDDSTGQPGSADTQKETGAE